MNPLTITLLTLGAAIVGAVLGALIWRSAVRRAHQERLDAARERQQAELQNELAQRRKTLEAEAAAAAQAARAEAERIVAGERARLERERATVLEGEARAQRRQEQLAAQERQAAEREAGFAKQSQQLERTLESAERREQRLAARETDYDTKLKALAEREQAILGAESAATQRLAEIAQLTPEAARNELLAKIDAELAAEQSARILRAQKAADERAKEIGVEIVSRAIQRYAAEHTAESTITRIKIADEELKGRVIGKEGRNIKSFEQVAGVDVIIDEGPGIIGISCFDPVRREIARRSLELLLEDGRIHPARIEEVMAEVTAALDAEIQQLGEDAALSCEVSGLHPQILRLLGKLHFRTSYGQNVLQHSKEVAYLCAAMAADLGLDPRFARRCGLLHDVGKAIDHEQEGSHPQLGYEALKRYNENELVANAALAHHEGFEVKSAFTVLAAAADAISAARPGARSHNTENYLKRLQQLEDIACSQPGVQKAYAIQAGRELRVIINGHTLGDHDLPKVAHAIARKVEEQVAFPGEVKVTVIRETRHFAVAR